jgi:hypothetical protein
MLQLLNAKYVNEYIVAIWVVLFMILSALVIYGMDLCRVNRNAVWHVSVDIVLSVAVWRISVGVLWEGNAV